MATVMGKGPATLADLRRAPIGTSALDAPEPDVRRSRREWKLLSGPGPQGGGRRVAPRPAAHLGGRRAGRARRPLRDVAGEIEDAFGRRPVGVRARDLRARRA